MKFNFTVHPATEFRNAWTKTLVKVNGYYKFIVTHHSNYPIKNEKDAFGCFISHLEGFLELHPREGEPDYNSPSGYPVKGYTNYQKWLRDYGYEDSTNLQPEWAETRRKYIECKKILSLSREQVEEIVENYNKNT